MPFSLTRFLSSLACIVDLVFVFDGSISLSSIGRVDWNNMLEFMARVVDLLNPGPNGARIGFIQYGSDVTNEFFLNTYERKVDITNRIRGLTQMGGRTNTERALVALRREQFVYSRGDRSDVRNVAIVMTDGQSN
ncbi:hypothetical protein CAPTEDRAFT_119197, partial [Capitella teleta]